MGNHDMMLPLPDQETSLVDTNDAVAYLVARARRGKLALLVGAGASASAGLPLWRDVGDAIKKEINKLGSDPGDVSVLAQILFEEWEKSYGDVRARQELLHLLEESLDTLSEERESGRWGNIYPLLGALPVRNYFTTNWDPLLSQYLRKVGMRQNVRRLAEYNMAGHMIPASTDEACHVVHLHGFLPDQGVPDSIILTSDDYFDFENKARNVFERLVRQLEADTTLLGIGYAFHDINVLQ